MILFKCWHSVQCPWGPLNFLKRMRCSLHSLQQLHFHRNSTTVSGSFQPHRVLFLLARQPLLTLLDQYRLADISSLADLCQTSRLLCQPTLLDQSRLVQASRPLQSVQLSTLLAYSARLVQASRPLQSGRGLLDQSPRLCQTREVCQTFATLVIEGSNNPPSKCLIDGCIRTSMVPMMKVGPLVST